MAGKIQAFGLKYKNPGEIREASSMKMAIITRYLSHELLKFMGILMTTLVIIYFSVDFFEKIDDFLSRQIPISSIVAYFALKIPFVVTQMIPLCLLLAVLVVFGLMTRHNEILVLKSSGVSVYYLFSPISLIGILFGIILFVLSEAVVPVTMERSNRIWNEQIKNITVQKTEGKNIWLKGQNSIIHIKYFNPMDQSIVGVSVYRYDDGFRLVRRIDAKKGKYSQGRWLLQDVMEQRADASGLGYETLFHDEKRETIDIFPEDLTRAVKNSEEMSYLELEAFIDRIESEGYDATPYRVDLYAKVSFPVICLLLCIIATGVAFRWRIRENLPLSIAVGIGIAFFYWLFNSVCLSLGYGEVLPPVIAAWAANLFFFCFGVFLLAYAE